MVQSWAALKAVQWDRMKVALLVCRLVVLMDWLLEQDMAVVKAVWLVEK